MNWRRHVGIAWRAILAGALSAVTVGAAGGNGMEVFWAFAVPAVTWLAGSYEVDARSFMRRPVNSQ